MNKWFALAAIILAALVVYSQNSKQIKDSLVPAKPVPPSIYSAWVPTWDQDRVLVSLASSSAKLSYLSPVWYKLEINGQISEITAGKKEQIKAIIKDKRVKLIPTIFNEFDTKRTAEFLQGYKTELNKLVNIGLEQGFAGFDLDFEEINLADKDLFSQFVADLANSLHEKGLILTVSVQAQAGNLTDREASRAQNLTQIAKSADFVRVMIYDYHNTQTQAGPITPIPEYKQVLEYMVKVVPKEKLVVGLPLYGYKWNKNKNDSVTYQDINKLLQNSQVKVNRDGVSSEQVIQYLENGVTNIVWVEDSQSIIYKAKIAREYGIYQFSFWRLGGEDLSLWEKL